MRLDHQDVEALGSAIDRGGQPRGPGANHYDVAHPVPLDGHVQPEAVGDFLVGWVFQDPVVTADDHRHVLEAELEAIEEHLDARVFFYVEAGVWLAIAREELANPQGRRGMARSDQDSVALVVGDQRHPAEDERAQEDLAQLGIGLHHLPQRVRRHLQELAVLAHPAANQGPAPGQNGRFSGELARSVEDCDRLLPAVDQVNDLYLAGNDDVEIARGVALVEQDGSARDAPALTALAQPLDLLGRQPRKHLIAALKVLCHGSPASARSNYGDRRRRVQRGVPHPQAASSRSLRAARAASRRSMVALAPSRSPRGAAP